ncbi:AI-2E family transporter [Silvibacterium bohemicum]|uniref:AI-2E family transporter n=1 Tax=Silvibacterium bohemicum TaxID=1577686 RepID=UPI00067849CE|nr:AI-2E family transporter [Silvibacterium bohemicum]
MLTKFWDPATARILCTTLILALVLAFLYEAQETLTLFLFAILFAYLVEPLVARLVPPLRGRIKAIAAVYLILIAVLVGLGFLVGPRIAAEGRSLATSLPTLLDRMGSGQLVSQIGRKQGWSEVRQVQIQSLFVAHRPDILRYAQALGGKLAEPVQHIWWLILIPILSLFFLKDGLSIANGIIDLGRTPEEKRTIGGIVGDINVMLGSYIRAQLILASLTVMSYTLALSVMRVPYAFILGPLAGLFEFVPVVGPALASVMVFVIAILTSYPHLVWLFLFLGAWRVVQDYVNAPRIMGRSLEIPPVVQIFGVLSGGEIAGVVGALISVPAIATLRILWRRMTSDRSVDAPVTSPPPTDHM